MGPSCYQRAINFFSTLPKKKQFKHNLKQCKDMHQRNKSEASMNATSSERQKTIQIKRKDENSGEFLKNLTQIEGGKVIQSLRNKSNQHQQTIQSHWSLERTEFNTERLPNTKIQRGILNHIDNSFSPFLFNLKKDQSVAEGQSSLPIKLNINNQACDSFYLTEHKVHEKKNEFRCKYCQHCKNIQESYLQNEEVLFLDKINFSEIIQNCQRWVKKISPDVHHIDDNSRTISFDKDSIKQLLASPLYKGTLFGKFHSEETKGLIKDIEFEDFYAKFLNDIIVQNNMQGKIKDLDFLKLVNEDYKESILKLIQQKKDPNQEVTLPFQSNDQGVLRDFLAKKKSQKQIEMLQQSKQDSNKYKCLALYVGIQELLRQLTENNQSLVAKDRGFMVLKLFKEYFKENEKQWKNILSQINIYIKSLKYDREMLMNKYKLNISDLEEILDNNEDTESNLISHKRIIKILVGMLNASEEQRLKLEENEKMMKEKFARTFYDAEKLWNDDNLFRQIEQVQVKEILDYHKKRNDLQSDKADKSNMTLLINAEKLLLAAKPYKSRLQFEKDICEINLKQMQEERKNYKALARHYEILLEQEQEKVKEGKKEIKNLISFLKSGTGDSSFWKVYFKKDEDVENDEKSITNDDLQNFQGSLKEKKQLLQRRQMQKIKAEQKIVQELIHSVRDQQYGNLQPLETVIEMMQYVYSKRSQEMQVKQLQKEIVHVQLEDHIYTYFKQRYSPENKAKEQFLDFFQSLRQYTKKDERVETFLMFLPGLEVNEDNKYDRKYQKEIFELFMKLQKSTDCSINQILASDQKNQLLFGVKTYFEKAERTVFYNASIPIKISLMRSLVYESDLYIDGKKVPVKDMTIHERFELYILWEFYKQTDATSIQEFASVLEKKCKSTNEYGLALYDEFKTVFDKMIGSWDAQVAFQFFTFDDLMNKYFPKSIKIIEGKKYIGFRGMRSFYKHQYELKCDIGRFLNIGLKIIVIFYEETKDYYKRIFSQVDQDGSGTINFFQFQQLFRKVKADMPQWKIFAIFQSTANQEHCDEGVITFNEFLGSCLNLPLMEGLMNNIGIEVQRDLLENKGTNLKEMINKDKLILQSLGDQNGKRNQSMPASPRKRIGNSQTIKFMPSKNF